MNFRNLSLLLLSLFFTSQAFAQDANNRWSFEVGTNAVHFFNEDKAEDALFEEITDFDDWDAVPAPSLFKLGWFAGDGVRATGTVSFSQVDKVDGVEPGDQFFLALDAGFEYDFRYATGMEDGWFAPYLGVGAGYYWLDEEGGISFNPSIGFDFYMTENIVLNVQSTYRHSFEDDQNQAFQHLAGIKFVYGGTDSDGDGIYDRNDECPETPGLEEFNGCPDDDGDGIRNSEDDCPQVYGPADNNGCPDSDGDGILDKDDECPQEAGPAYNDGCPDPDTDGDGILDSKDECPNTPGVASENGCPIPDRDGDGIRDNEDQCPDVAGVEENNGCPPVPTKTEQKQLNQYAKTILFETGKSSIKKESEETLEAIMDILEKYPDAKFSIDGHTDSRGSKQLNQRLSDARANAVRDYLVENGIEQFRLSATGYGESQPIASNDTAEGRAQNRRVEINLVEEEE